ncbi:MAG: DUF554 domain-containing protein [Sphaerochaetaceae bacterium]
MIATYVNCIAVIAGALIGLMLRSRVSEKFKEIVMASSGLVTIVLGIKMALESANAVALILSMMLGGVAGYALRIEEGVLAVGEKLERLARRDKKARRIETASEAEGVLNEDAVFSDGNGLGAAGRPDAEHSTDAGGRTEGGSMFAQGFMSASILFCSGAMTVVGSIQAGTAGEYQTLLVKSIMDGCMAIVFGAAYGIGVAFSSLFILVYQGFFTLAGGWIEPLIGDAGINELAAAGGVLLMMIGLGLLGLRRFKTANFLPSLVLAPVLLWAVSQIPFLN